jgi:peroxiredoxin
MNRFLFIFLMLMSPMVLSTFGQGTDYAKFGIETKNSHIPEGLKVGDRAPDFIAYDQEGKQVELNKLLEKGPVVLFFYRGKWCPVCSRYLNDYQDSLNLIVDQGFNVVGVTPETIDNVEETVRFHNLTFKVLYDCQEEIMKDYDVMFTVTKEYQDKILNEFNTSICENNGRDVAHLPVPATYIINRDGIIVAEQFNPDYHFRASVKWMLLNMGKAL